MIMGTITTKDGTHIFCKYWGTGQPLLTRLATTADAGDAQMVFLGQRGYRVIAHDRRSHGRSTWEQSSRGRWQTSAISRRIGAMN
jgi:non-heme chloroperoxidase